MKIRQIYKHTPVILLGTTFFYCFASHFHINSWDQYALANDTQTKEETKGKTKENAKTAAKTQNQVKAGTKYENADWWADSKLGAKLIHEGKYAEAESVLSHILPQARHNAPDSLDLAISLARYGMALLAEKKYTQSLTPLKEAVKIASRKPATPRQQRAMFQILGAIAASCFQTHKFDQAELYTRKAIAYAIAFPRATTPADTKKVYALLCAVLQSQNKLEEANVIADILNYI